MAEIRWTFEAELWLKEIYEYIALDNPQAAKEVVDGIYTTAQMFKGYNNALQRIAKKRAR